MRARPIGRPERRALVFNHPPRNALSRALYVVFNLVMQLTGEQLSGDCPPAGRDAEGARAHGLRPSHERRSRTSQLAGLQRPRRVRRPADRTPPDRDRTASLHHSHASSKQAETSRLICQNLVRKLISIGRQPVLIAATRCYLIQMHDDY